MDIPTLEKMISILKKTLPEEIELFDNLKKEHSLDQDWVKFCESNSNELHKSFHKTN